MLSCQDFQLYPSGMSFTLQTIEEGKEAESRLATQDIFVDNADSDQRVSDESISEKLQIKNDASPAKRTF